MHHFLVTIRRIVHLLSLVVNIREVLVNRRIEYQRASFGTDVISVES